MGSPPDADRPSLNQPFPLIVPNGTRSRFTPISAVLNPEEDKQVVDDENVPKPLLISLNVLKQHTDAVPEIEDEEEIISLAQSVETGPKDQTPEEMEQEIERLRKSMKEQEERLKRLERQMEK